MIIATCCAVLMLGTATTAELPPRRPPAAPFPAEPPTAETVRHLHEMLPPPNGDEPMSEEEMATSFQRFLNARGLHDTFSGGIGSYLLQLMIIST